MIAALLTLLRSIMIARLFTLVMLIGTVFFVFVQGREYGGKKRPRG